MRRFIFVLCFFPLSLLAQNYPDHQTTYVNDFANILDRDTENRIVEMLDNVRDERGVEMTVVTIDSRHDYGSFTAIEPFATGLFNYWGVGDATRNDGIMVLVAIDDRDMRIELGKGYADIFDDRAKNVIDHYFLPYFRENKYAQGIEAGVAETIKRIRIVGSGSEISFWNMLGIRAENIYYSIMSGGVATWIVGIIAGIGGIRGGFGIKRFMRNKPRECDLCGRKMIKLTEESDDDHLSYGQKVEESVKSKDYDVWLCRNDDHVMIQGYRRWFTMFKVCDNCGFHTLHSKRTIVQSATTRRTGTARIDYNCRHCGDSYSKTVTIAKKSNSSSSSSGSSGSFGGGSSSGGGASGSW